MDEREIRQAAMEAIKGHWLAKTRDFERLLVEVAEAAIRSNPDPDTLRSRIHDGVSVVDSVVFATNEGAWRLKDDDNRDPKLWWHSSRVSLAPKPFSVPYINVMDTDAVAAQYLDLPYRVESLDRLLIDMLIASEMFAFADEVQNRLKALKRILPLAASWVFNNVRNLIVGGAIAGALWWIAPNSQTMNVLALIVLGVTLISVAISVIAFPFLYSSLAKSEKRLRDTIQGMLSAYRALDGSPTSIIHLSERLKRADEAGVEWPAPLMVLVEDIGARRSSV